MRSVEVLLGLPYTTRFLGKLKQPFPARFLWQTTIDWETGIRKDFDPSCIVNLRALLNDEQLARVYADATIVESMNRFVYEA
jgi:hypothetical protein